MRIAILGAGSWGTALALQAVRCGTETSLWGRDPERVAAMNRTRENADYLPGFELPRALTLEADLATAVGAAKIVLLAPPSHGFPQLLKQVVPHLSSGARVAWATKGFEPGSGRLLHLVAEAMLGADRPGAVITGPSFAREVAQDLPTAVTVASQDHAFARRVVAAFHGGNFRAYSSDDIIGAELGGAVKNVMAVGTGIADGMGLGTNARAALITRGLAEMMRLSAALGAQRETLMGLSGVGDLVLTCTGELSRNRRFGHALGQGVAIDQALADIGQVVEGARTAEELMRLAGRHGVELPIAEQVHRIIKGEITPRQGLINLLSRQQKAEND